MSNQYEVLWSESAEDDLMRILEYIAVDDLQNAQNLFKKIKENADSLYIHLNRGRIVPELKDHGILQYREIIVRPWRILYLISKQDVYVLAVIDSRQNFEDILVERFVKSSQSRGQAFY